LQISFSERIVNNGPTFVKVMNKCIVTVFFYSPSMCVCVENSTVITKTSQYLLETSDLDALFLK